jgi:hypothetical protein
MGGIHSNKGIPLYDGVASNVVAKGYTTEVRIRHILLITLAFLIAACNKAPQNNDAIKQAVVEHLGKGSGLDMSRMDVTVDAVSYSENQAKATVSFRPKSAPEQGMSMLYTLESKGNKWVVLKKEGSGAGHSQGMGAPDAAAPGGAAAPEGQALPPGHPAVPEQPKKAESQK